MKQTAMARRIKKRFDYVRKVQRNRMPKKEVSDKYNSICYLLTIFFIGDSESDVDQEQEDANLIKGNKS